MSSRIFVALSGVCLLVSASAGAVTIENPPAQRNLVGNPFSIGVARGSDPLGNTAGQDPYSVVVNWNQFVLNQPGQGSVTTCSDTGQGCSAPFPAAWLNTRARYVAMVCTNSCVASQMFYIQSAPVVNNFSWSGSPVAGNTLTFSAEGTADSLYSAHGNITNFKWTFSDGTTIQGPVVNKSFATGGTFTVSVRGFDGYFWSAAMTKTITVASKVRPRIDGCGENGTICQ